MKLEHELTRIAAGGPGSGRHGDFSTNNLFEYKGYQRGKEHSDNFGTLPSKEYIRHHSTKDNATYAGWHQLTDKEQKDAHAGYAKAYKIGFKEGKQ